MSIRIVALVMVCACAATVTRAQLKSQWEERSRVSEGLTRPSDPSALWMGVFDPARFSMRHSFNLSYLSAGGQGMSLGMYTNTMMYQVLSNLSARADISLMYSPYGNSGVPGNTRSDLSSIYLSRAQLDYRPWENVAVQVQYRAYPLMMTPGWYGIGPEAYRSWYPWADDR